MMIPVISMLASELIMPAALLTTLCATSNTPMMMSHVLVTISTAQKVLKIHLKNIHVSKSCILFFSTTICKSSIVITTARITPAMGRITLSDRLRIMLNTPLFHAAGVVPTCTAMSPTCGSPDQTRKLNCP